MAILDWLPRLLVGLAFGCIAGMGLSQATDVPAAHPLEGQVVDSVTGQPIARALVRAGNHDALTDHEGRFSFDNAQENTATASKPGYLGESMPPGGSGPLLLRLIPEAILFGTVTDADFQPLQHMPIQLRQLQVRAGLVHWQEMQNTRTNAEGEFRFAELAAGRYSLATGLIVDGLPEAAATLAFAPTVYPPAASGEAQGAVTLRAGGNVQANLNLAAEKLCPVSGVLHGSFGPGGGFAVETLDGLAVSTDPHFFPDSGVFRFRLPRGSYRLHAQRQGENQQQFAGTREITVGPAGLEGVSIVLAPLPSIPVEVEYQRSSSGRQQEPTPAYLNLSLNAEDSANSSMVAAQPVEVGSARTPQPGDPLIFRSVPPAHYVLQAQIFAPWYVAAATCGSADLTRDPLLVGDGTGACSMRVVLRDDSSGLQWSVANPHGMVTVMAYPLANLVQTVGGANAYVSSDGDRIQGALSDLAPGRYLVIAARHNLDLPYRDPEALKQYLSWGKEVTLDPNSQLAIELELAPESDAFASPGEP